jgi:hypothetical protein
MTHNRTWAAAVYQFLQTNLGLFVLAAIFVSLVPYAWTAIISRHQQEVTRNTELKQLHNELRFRMEQWLRYSVVHEVDDKYKGNVRGFIDVLIRTPAPNDPLTPIYPVYREYAELSLVGLLARGAVLSDGPGGSALYERPIPLILSGRAQPNVAPASPTLNIRATRYLHETELWEFSPKLPVAPYNIRFVTAPPVGK